VIQETKPWQKGREAPVNKQRSQIRLRDWEADILEEDGSKTVHSQSCRSLSFSGTSTDSHLMPCSGNGRMCLKAREVCNLKNASKGQLATQ
jgi:hypothetical protein